MPDTEPTTDAPAEPQAEPEVIEIAQESNPADVMVPGRHLACGNVNFRRGRCRDSYLGRRTCDSCEPPPAEPSVVKPAPSASKADWVAYAVARGDDPATAEASTKAELIARHG